MDGPGENLMFPNSCDDKIQLLRILHQIVFKLNEDNFEESIQQTIKLFDSNFPYSFNLYTSILIYSAYYLQGETDVYLKYLQVLQQKEEEINEINPKIIEIFIDYIYKIKSQETYYIVEQMIEQNLVDKEIITNFQTNYFAHYMKEYVDDSFYSTIKEEIQKNDWELHKKYIKEGHNPNEIAKLLRNDEIEKLQEISSQQNFDFNQTIEPSLYERCSFINQRNVTLIDYAAFFSAVKCFKYLLVNGSNFQNAGKYAVAGGNTEIVHLCEQNGSSFNGAYEAAIKYHRNDIFRYIYENELENLAESEKQNITSFQQYRNQRNQQPNNENQNNETTNTITKIASKYTNLCNMCGNIEILLFLEEEGIKIDDQIINEAAYFGNLYLVQHYLNNHQPPKDIFSYSTQAGNIELVKYVLGLGGIDINVANKKGQTAIFLASNYGYLDIVKLLLEQGDIDFNCKDGKQSPIFAAAVKNHDEIAKLLLEKEIDEFRNKTYVIFPSDDKNDIINLFAT